MMDVSLAHQRAVEDDSKYIRSSFQPLDPHLRFLLGRALHRHECEALRLIADGCDCIVPAGGAEEAMAPGLAAILHGLLSPHSCGGIRAVIVCPTRALIHEQLEALHRCERNHQRATGSGFPVTFAAWSSQEPDPPCERLRQHPPQLLLTDAAMLDRCLMGWLPELRDSLRAHLRFLVIEHIDGCRGLEGADLALLVRRLQAQCQQPLLCIGTAALPATDGNAPPLRTDLGSLASLVFGRRFPPERLLVASSPREGSATVAAQSSRLELMRQELLQAHLYALAVSETGLAGGLQGDHDRPALSAWVDASRRELPLRPDVRAVLYLGPQARERVHAAFERSLLDLRPPAQARAGWLTGDWVERTLDAWPERLDRALDRWRVLYRSASATLEKATQQLQGGLLRPGGAACRDQQRRRDEAAHQLALLRNECRDAEALSEFHPACFLAAEGVLPGHDAIRKPLRAFLSREQGPGAFVSFPRDVALRALGPLALFHHQGRRYRVTGVVVRDPESALSAAKLSRPVGCLLEGDERRRETCPVSGASLSDPAACERLHDLLEMADVRAEEVADSACEEEPHAPGFDIDTFFSIGDGGVDSVRPAALKAGGQTLLELRCLPGARLVQLNRRWSDRQEEGFPLDLVSGAWCTSEPQAGAMPPQRLRRVKLHASNRADVLLLLPTPALGLRRDGIVALQQFLLRAMALRFGLAPDELGAAITGAGEGPGILLWETERAGPVLSSLVADAEAFQTVVAQARTLDSHPHPIRDALDRLGACVLERPARPPEEDGVARYARLLQQLDPGASAARRFIEHLHAHGLRLPDAARKRADGLYVRPDFHYAPRVWIFCDDTPLDGLAVREAGEAQREALLARGDEVWVWQAGDDLAACVAQRPDLFSPLR